jgi:hypothetical protein
MPLSWNEIKARALAFSKKWEHETSEDAEAKSFWDGFFEVFGIDRKRVATFEEAVKKGDSKQGFIDLLWKGHILVEHKSKGKDLDKAFQQAKDYFPGLKEGDLPHYILVSDFDRFRLYHLETRTQNEFSLKEFVQNVHLFGFIAGYEKRTYKDEDLVNIKAAELMGKLHDKLEETGYSGHALELYLVRLLFCLFADDTGIFGKGILWQYLDLHTKPDGSDLAMHLSSIFHTLNTPKEQRLKNLDENLAQFEYINGRLFEENLPPAAFDSKMRDMLLETCALDWGSISPAIFGSMFQAVMNPKERRNLGAHYTSEKNIQKVIRPLFLDDLYTEFEKAKGNRARLNEFHRKIASLHFLDPACGCGNFLIISYRELRELELQILRELNKSGQGFLDIREIMLVNVDQFAGIEYDEFPARIAEVAMWLIDHQMNMKVSSEFGQYFARLPLTKAAKIVHGNALRVDWADVVPKEELSYILGNPPFIGSKLQTEEQRADMVRVYGGVQDAAIMDYVSSWHIKSAQFIQNTTIRCAFVSTNSICQGEQVSVLWAEMLNHYNIKIHFAHRTFKWSNEAKGNAAVFCLIVGFANFDIPKKTIFDYENVKGEAHEIMAKNINPYLVDAPDLVITKRTKPISNVPEMNFGNMPLDGGHFLFSDDEKREFLTKEPKAEKFFKPLLSAHEFLNGENRWCLWLVNALPNDLRSMPEVLKRIEAVKIFRLASIAPSTRQHASTPSLFRDRNNPATFILIPLHSSERRKYIPLGLFDQRYIANNSTSIIGDASTLHFGILSSEMHMVWIKYTCGRIKSDFRYSKNIVYNNYPFPLFISEIQKQKVEDAVQLVLETRAKYPGSSLADLYDPVTMPPDLMRAHQALDKAVDLCYRPQVFGSELARIEFLFGLYEQYTAPMFGGARKAGKK